MNARMPSSRLYAVCLLGLAALTLGGRGGDMDDLRSWVDETKARPGGRIEPLPTVKPAPSHVYQAEREQFRSPFVAAAPQMARSGPMGPRPDTERPRQFLEQFPLDTLSMVGTLTREGSTYGLVQTQDGLVHRVSPGDYLGQNDGRIDEIGDAEINGNYIR